MFRIKELPISEKPRERLIEKGAEALSDSELIAIILATGTQKQNVVELAKALLMHYKLDKLLNASFEELCAAKGLGKAKACQLIACGELSRRLGKQQSNAKLLSPNAVVALCSDIAHKEKEHLVALFLNTRAMLIKRSLISIGNLDSSIIDPREILKEALRCNAKSIILVHNHPSGEPEPSEEDLKVTAHISQACQLLNIGLTDHIILGMGKYYSLKEHGEL